MRHYSALSSPASEAKSKNKQGLPIQSLLGSHSWFLFYFSDMFPRPLTSASLVGLLLVTETLSPVGLQLREERRLLQA